MKYLITIAFTVEAKDRDEAHKMADDVAYDIPYEGAMPASVDEVNND